MHRNLLVCSAVAVALVACAKAENKPADTAKPAAAAPAPPAAISLADIAGNWNMSGKTMPGDSTVATYVLHATPNTSGWTVTFTGRPAMPASVSVSGDSIMVDTGPYESVLRKGVKVTAHAVQRLQNGMLVGTTVAHYDVKTADSVITLKSEGSRAP